jgi:hypothetical protein
LPRLQSVELFAKTRQARLHRGVATYRLERARQLAQLVFDPRQACFELRVALLGTHGAFVGAPQLLGDPGFGLTLAAHEQRDGLHEQAVLLARLVVRRVRRHQAGL